MPTLRNALAVTPTRVDIADRRDNWRLKARCATLDPYVSDAIFYPRTDDTVRSWAAARRECAKCPVREMCLAVAMDEEARRSQSGRHGFRGGMSPAERAALAEGAA